MIGTQIDNYRILEKIGDGGMGSVYKAVDVMLEREVALKFLRPELASQPDLVERFRSEAIVLAKLHHPNIASLYGLHKHGDDFFMAMEYVRGETLDATIRTSKQLAIPQASDVASSVLGALEYAHSQGIVHRDIKSANIILGPTGCKVMDFGIARVLGTDRRTRVGFVVGTIGYMAPEQIQGMDVDGRADIYALGVVLYEMITGRVPFEGESEWAVMQAQVQQMPVPPRVFASHIPVSLENTVMRALAKQPQDRFQSAVEFQRAIQGALRQSGFHQTTSFIAVPQQEDSMIAAPGDETREHKSNPHLASGEVAVGSGAFVMPPPSPASLTGPQQAFPPPVPRVPTAPAQPVPTPPAAVRPVAAVPAAGAPAQAKAAQAKAASASPAAARRSNAPLIAMLAVVAVVVAGGGAVAWRMWKARAAEVPPAETTQAATDPAATLDPAASVPPPAASVAPTPIVPAPATSSGSGHGKANDADSWRSYARGQAAGGQADRTRNAHGHAARRRNARGSGSRRAGPARVAGGGLWRRACRHPARTPRAGNVGRPRAAWRRPAGASAGRTRTRRGVFDGAERLVWHLARRSARRRRHPPPAVPQCRWPAPRAQARQGQLPDHPPGARSPQRPQDHRPRRSVAG